MKLLPHQQRVAEEKVDLDIKISKLDNFIHGPIYPTLEQTERLRLTLQFVYMKEYSNVLTERIIAFRTFEWKSENHADPIYGGVSENDTPKPGIWKRLRLWWESEYD